MKCVYLVFVLSLLVPNIFSQSWLQLADYGATARDDGSSFVIDDKAYCFSGLENGWQCTGNGFVFDGVSETWSPMASLSIGKERQYATGFAYNNKGYLLGGLKFDNLCLSDFLEYSPISNTWVSLPNFLGAGRQGMSNFIIKNKVYIIGGRLADNTTINEVWEYDFTTTTWVQKSNLPTAMWRGSSFCY